MIDLSKAQSFSEKLAIKLGEHILASRNRIQVVEQKDIMDICTNIDKEVEQLAIDAIKAEYPDHNIHSEECGLIDKQSEYTWYLDPIDGTKEFLRDVPIYNTNLSLETKTEILTGVVYHPLAKQLFSSRIDSDAYKNYQKVSVSSIDTIEKSFVYAYLPSSKLRESRFNQVWSTLGKINMKAYRLRGIAECVQGLCWVGSGSAEAFVEMYCIEGDKWHDVSAGILMVERAGGKVTDLLGNRLTKQNFTNGIIATNGHIHGQLLKIIQKSLATSS